jgi:hypothetical protein
MSWPSISFPRQTHPSCRSREKSSQGTLTNPNGSVYSGSFADDVEQGQGSYKDAGGWEYHGLWQNGKRNGQGKIVYSDGSVYEGDWANDERQGQGTQVYVDGVRDVSLVPMLANDHMISATDTVTHLRIRLRPARAVAQ